ncbi:uncharacterized protein LOC117178267 [Belonocnema kinseyi]|uniref:uncharacterized protein LOC117178267 n=1 Tax=Belonocnema kinseyi TaxID=2817044 RepID=UPI00143DD229|nr:uncharacterized protein LOC117178267 [Belonocnema kinseyi]
MATNQAQFTHNIYKNDPILFKSYINKNVHILTEDDSVQTGLLYTIDPVSESIVLIQPEDSNYQMKIILGHAVKNIEVSSDPETIIPELFSAPSVQISKSVISERRNTIKKILLENRFPVTEDNGIIRIEDALSIEPPYELDNFICDNTIVLDRIQKILSSVIK